MSHLEFSSKSRTESRSSSRICEEIYLKSERDEICHKSRRSEERSHSSLGRMENRSFDEGDIDKKKHKKKKNIKEEKMDPEEKINIGFDAKLGKKIVRMLISKDRKPDFLKREAKKTETAIQSIKKALEKKKYEEEKRRKKNNKGIERRESDEDDQKEEVGKRLQSLDTDLANYKSMVSEALHSSSSRSPSHSAEISSKIKSRNATPEGEGSRCKKRKHSRSPESTSKYKITTSTSGEDFRTVKIVEESSKSTYKDGESSDTTVNMINKKKSKKPSYDKDERKKSKSKKRKRDEDSEHEKTDVVSAEAVAKKRKNPEVSLSSSPTQKEDMGPNSPLALSKVRKTQHIVSAEHNTFGDTLTEERRDKVRPIKRPGTDKENRLNGHSFPHHGGHSAQAQPLPPPLRETKGPISPSTRGYYTANYPSISPAPIGRSPLQLPPSPPPLIVPPPVAVDVNALFANLVKSGMIRCAASSWGSDSTSRVDTVASTVPGIQTATLPETHSWGCRAGDTELLKPEVLQSWHPSLKERQPGMIEMLYRVEDWQCKTCGERFSSEENKSVQAHMDRHFREESKKRSLKEQNRKLPRGLYLDKHAWVGDQSEDETAKKTEKELVVEEDTVIPTVAWVDEMKNSVCHVCGEDFDTFYKQDETEVDGTWYLKNAMRTEYGVFHPQCHIDKVY